MPQHFLPLKVCSVSTKPGQAAGTEGKSERGQKKEMERKKEKRARKRNRGSTQGDW